MRQKVWEHKHRLGSFRRKAKLPARSSSAEALSPAPFDDTQQPPHQEPHHQLSVESPPATISPNFSRRPSLTGGRRSSLGLGSTPTGYQTGPPNRHDKYRRRRSVSPIDPRDMLFRRSSTSRYDDETDPLMYGQPPEERVQSPTLFGVDNDLLDISPVPMSRRQSFDRSPRMSFATSPRDQAAFFSEHDPIPYLRQLSTHYSQDRERRLSQTYPEGRPLTLPADRYDPERGDTESVDSDDRNAETRI